ncbi:hypothetical protein B1R32_11650 [Abditibacterium utsteinense]|uniref:N-acetyltransferase domain-containing protein n=1 Tax=Abditibacterium utsteinense TaxID=1960156 RepID=A0A2S8SQJ9_9BACT|nr:GNAT family N-acetyltransferase [Abditibacterium utsteinense]PQV63073.1 hypothetical protein B1R32_11650 [Abditibacterium utsteinense]
MNFIAHNVSQSRFETSRHELLSVADYQLSEKVMTVTHIIVPSSLRGQGIASDLARAIIAHARAEGLKVRPQCPFMAAFFDRHAEEADLRV